MPRPILPVPNSSVATVTVLRDGWWERRAQMDVLHPDWKSPKPFKRISPWNAAEYQRFLRRFADWIHDQRQSYSRCAVCGDSVYNKLILDRDIITLHPRNMVCRECRWLLAEYPTSIMMEDFISLMTDYCWLIYQHTSQVAAPCPKCVKRIAVYEEASKYLQVWEEFFVTNGIEPGSGWAEKVTEGFIAPRETWEDNHPDTWAAWLAVKDLRSNHSPASSPRNT